LLPGSSPAAVAEPSTAGCRLDSPLGGKGETKYPSREHRISKKPRDASSDNSLQSVQSTSHRRRRPPPRSEVTVGRGVLLRASSLARERHTSSKDFLRSANDVTPSYLSSDAGGLSSGVLVEVSGFSAVACVEHHAIVSDRICRIRGSSALKSGSSRGIMSAAWRRGVSWSGSYWKKYTGTTRQRGASIRSQGDPESL
jgi:hypothetical protein